jgi:hypothetical protein
MAMIGTAALAYSWQMQNQELVKASDDVSRLQRSQMVVDIDEIQRDQWLIALDKDISSVKPDPELLSVEAREAFEATLVWETHMKGRVADSPIEYQNQLAQRDAILAQAEKLAEANDYKALTQALQGLTRNSKDLTRALDQKFFDEVDRATGKVASLESNMRGWYLIGTALLLLSSITASLSLEVTLRHIEVRKVQRRN